MASMKEKLPEWIGDTFRQENPASLNNKQIMQALKEVRLILYWKKFDV